MKAPPKHVRSVFQSISHLVSKVMTRVGPNSDKPRQVMAFSVFPFVHLLNSNVKWVFMIFHDGPENDNFELYPQFI